MGASAQKEPGVCEDLRGSGGGVLNPQARSRVGSSFHGAKAASHEQPFLSLPFRVFLESSTPGSGSVFTLLMGKEEEA